MGKVAFVFAGQGAQYSGMGADIAEVSAAAKKVFEAADALRPGTSKQCFSGTEAELKETINTQPCMFAVEAATAAALEEKGIKADVAAGFSLGEVVALTYAKMLDFEAGFHLVCRRAELMQEAAEASEDTGMVAVLKLSPEKVEELCKDIPNVYPVNFNHPTQIVVAGAADQLVNLSAAVKEAGGLPITLKVKAAFHSPYMGSASEKFRAETAKYTFADPVIPLYSNKTATFYGENRQELLAEQIASPVRWESIVRDMVAQGVDTFVEIGPGNVLCGLINETDPSVKTYPVSNKEDFETVCKELAGC